MQRYKFKEEHGLRQSSSKEHVQKRCARLGEDSEAESPIASPSNNLTVLAHAFVNAIKLTTNLKYNLAWAYGLYLEEIPARLGLNEALDASADALICAHQSFCVYRTSSGEALMKYCRALSKLRNCLDDPVKASTSETLCAVSLLLICQVSRRTRVK
jgi:hypothetical protein